MDDRPAASVEYGFSFGPFRFLPAQQLLLEGETPVRLGSRAVEILAALVERPGELVTKSELMARVWPNIVVEEGNLKVHVAALRRALGDGQPGGRYVATVSGRGYRFVAPVNPSPPSMPSAHESVAESHTHNLPTAPTRTIGRTDTIDALRNQLLQSRFVTIAGPGGIGKTTVALAVAESLVAACVHGVRLVELASLQDSQFVPSAVASALGYTTSSENEIPGLIACLREKQMLILLDSCDHVIEAAASLAEQIIRSAPRVQILATSREPLRAAGEHVHRLSPLKSPPSSSELTATKALTFSAVQLFVERATASVDDFDLSDSDAPVVADICRKLEGIALAIELAATRVDAFGIRELAALLNDRFRLLQQGTMRTPLTRHRSLAAALDWSYDFLPEQERIILRRLAVFAGVFTLESASAVAQGVGVRNPEVIEGLANLVAKSLVTADISGAAVQYRLLDTTRTYVLQKLIASGEFEALGRRHAEYHRDLFERAEAEWATRPSAEWQADYGRKIDDVRSALNWAFSPGGDVSIGVTLTVAAIPLWMHLSLMDECRTCVERALATERAKPRRSDRDEMKLYTALGSALLYGRGPLPETDGVWRKALQIAERSGDSEYQLRALWGLTIYRVYVGNYRAALELGKKYRVVATKKGDAADRLSCDRLTATALHYLGEQTKARRSLERMLSQYVAPAHRSHIARFQFDQRVAARSTLSHILWLQGFPDRAVRTARATLEAAQTTNHALSLCNALGHAAFPVALYVGDLAAAEQFLSTLVNYLADYRLTVWNALGLCLRGLLLVKRGDATGLPLLRNALDGLRDMRFRLRYSAYVGTLANGLGACGQMTEARAAIAEALEWSERSEERWYMPELLRIKGELVGSEGSAGAVRAAEDHYRQALHWARRQGALSWELRAATSLAQLWEQHGRIREADKVLSSVYGRFNEGFETTDLKTARALLDCFGTTSA